MYTIGGYLAVKTEQKANGVFCPHTENTSMRLNQNYYKDWRASCDFVYHNITDYL